MPVLTVAQIKPLNDQNLMVSGLLLAGIPVVGATVTCTLVDEQNLPVAAIVALPLNDVVGSPGNYTGFIAGSGFMVAPGDYILQITAVGTTGIRYYVEQPAKVPYLSINSNLMVGALCSVAALKDWFKIPQTDNTYDTLYARTINRFTEYAAQVCNRPGFLVASYTERFSGKGNSFICPKFAFGTNELQSVTSLTINGNPIPVCPDDVTSGYIYDDYTIYLRGYAFDYGVRNVNLTYTAGLASIPLELEHAALEACAYWLKRREYIGQASVSVNGQTIVFDKEDVPSSTKAVLLQYNRKR